MGWERDLRVLWVGNFLIQAGFSMIMPFLPLYLEELHVGAGVVPIWSGLISSAIYLTMVLTAPFWGMVADRTGRKPMLLRSAFGMAAITWMMGMATSPWHLLLIRLLTGMFAGFVSGTAPFLAGRVPKEQSGQALGTLATGGVAGTLLGPLIGSSITGLIGYRAGFGLTSVLCLAAGLLVLLLIDEPVAARADTPRKRSARWHVTPDSWPVLLLLFLISLSLQTVEPILPMWLRSLHVPAARLTAVTALAVAGPGFAALLVAPRVGRWSDRYGARRVLLVCLAGSAAIALLHAPTADLWQSIALRFLFGICSGGLIPAVYSFLARTVPANVQGALFGLANSAMYLGNVAGRVLGGTVATWAGASATFSLTSLSLVFGVAVVAFGLGHQRMEELSV